MANFLLIKDISIPYQILDNNKLRNIRISINLNGIIVKKPSYISMSQISRMLENKSKWIYKHYISFMEQAHSNYNRYLKDGNKIDINGNKYTIKIVEGNNKRSKVILSETDLIVHINSKLPGVERDTLVHDIIKRFLRNYAKGIIKEKLDIYTNLIGLHYKNFRIKDQKTRWGSCSKLSNLNFNWRLIMAPNWVMDYVIVHEICHIKHLNHSREFWNLIQLYMPRYKEAAEWLKFNANSLDF